PVTALAFDSRVNMRSMREAHEVGQRVHAIPLNFERRRRVVRPRPRHRLDSTARDPVAVTSDAPRNRRNPRLRRPARIRMAVLAWNLVHPGVYAMTERYRLDYVRPWRPRPLRHCYRGPTKDEHRDGKQQHYAVHAHDQACQ